MASRAQRSKKQPAGAGESESAERVARRKRHPGRVVLRALLLSGVVAVVTKPEVRNRLLDALFGPEEQFDYDSTTEPAASTLDEDPRAAAGSDEPPPAASWEPEPAQEPPLAQAWERPAEEVWEPPLAHSWEAPADTERQHDDVEESEEQIVWSPGMGTAAQDETDRGEEAVESADEPPVTPEPWYRADEPAAGEAPTAEPWSRHEPAAPQDSSPPSEGHEAWAAADEAPAPPDEPPTAPAESWSRSAEPPTPAYEMWSRIDEPSIPSHEPQAGTDEAEGWADPTATAAHEPAAEAYQPETAVSHEPASETDEPETLAQEPETAIYQPPDDSPAQRDEHERDDVEPAAGADEPLEPAPAPASGADEPLEPPPAAASDADEAPEPPPAGASGDEAPSPAAEEPDRPGIGEANSPRNGWWIPRRRRTEPTREPPIWD